MRDTISMAERERETNYDECALDVVWGNLFFFLPFIFFFFLSRALSFLSTSSRIMRPHPGQIHTHIFILTRCFDSMREAAAAGASAALFANAYGLYTLVRMLILVPLSL